MKRYLMRTAIFNTKYMVRVFVMIARPDKLLTGVGAVGRPAATANKTLFPCPKCSLRGSYCITVPPGSGRLIPVCDSVSSLSGCWACLKVNTRALGRGALHKKGDSIPLLLTR